MLLPEEIVPRLRTYGIDPIDIPKTLSDTGEFRAKCLHCGNEFLFHFNKCVPTGCTVCNKRSTQLERQIADFISVKYKISQHSRILFKQEGINSEFDILIPDLNIAFEINGAYSHNTAWTPFLKGKPKPVNYHKIKTDIALKHGIKLYHIWEHWPKEKIFDFISSKLGIIVHKRFARNLSVSFDNTKSDEVVNSSHFLGMSLCSFSATLLEGNTPLTTIQFVVKDGEALLSRNASRSTYIVVGGFSKLLKHSIPKLKQLGVTKIITYADRDLTPDPYDSVYFKNGFNFIGDSGLTLSYYCHFTVRRDNEVILKTGVYKRNSFMKYKLKDMFEGATVRGEEWHFREEETEQQNLFRLGIFPIYNSGCFKYSLSI